MWTLLPSENINRYFQQYPYLAPFANELILHEGQGCVFLPRYFAYNYPSPLLNYLVDNTWEPKTADIEIKDGFELRENQLEICRTMVNIVDTPQTFGGIIKARPGAGKTVMAVYCAAMTKRKTIIILDNSNLMKQWTQAIEDFTKLTADDVGFIGGGKVEVDKPFTIALVQTLMSKAKNDMKAFYAIIKEQGFDLAFFDECHATTCGPKYATASLFLNTVNVFGLSATPFADNLHKVFMDNALGPIVAQEDEYELVPKINFVYFNSGLEQKYGRQLQYVKDRIRKRSMYQSKLQHSHTYMNIMVQLVKELLQEGHKIIIIVFTVELVKLIHQLLADHGIDSRQFYSQKREIDKENDDVIVATYKYAGAGFDMAALSAAIIGTPLSGKKSLIQVIGRILRSYAGKNAAVVYDFVDKEFNGEFLKDVPRKKGILANEFGCEFNDIQM